MSTVSRSFCSLPKSLFFVSRSRYSLIYDCRLKQPAFVIEVLRKEAFEGFVSRKNMNFRRDPDLPEEVSASLDDYKHSGYTRGHLSAAANHKCSRESMKESFYLSNVSPQAMRLNCGLWGDLEERTRKLAMEHLKVTVISGPLFVPVKAKNGKKVVIYEVIGENNVAVPTHFFKVIFVGKKIEAYILPNRDSIPKKSLDDFQTTFEKVKKLSGLHFGKF
ncbi:MAG: DNA/RNA non-specific endonuclease [Waddliaceae bacterium]